MFWYLFVVAEAKSVHQRRPSNFSAFRPKRSKKASHSVKEAPAESDVRALTRHRLVRSLQIPLWPSCAAFRHYIGGEPFTGDINDIQGQR
jgi:hypothetical protein